MRKKVLNDTQQGLASDPLPFKGVHVRATRVGPGEETLE